MATTIQEIITAGYNRNQMNDENVLAGDSELILLISRKQQRAFLDAGKINPDFFGADASPSLSSGVASLSGISPTVGIISHVEIANAGTSNYTSGDEVNLVRTSEKDNELPPRMYRQTNKLVGVGSDLTSVTSVKIYYSQVPAALFSAADPSTLYMSLPDEHADVLITEAALYLAIKDNRGESELATLKAEVKEAKDNLLFIAELNIPTNRRFGG